MAKLDELRASVAAQKTVVDGVIVLLASLKTKLEEAGTDQAAINEIVAEIDSEKEALAAAVATFPPDDPTV